MNDRAEQFARLVIRPALQVLEAWSPAAEALVLGTALAESGLDYVQQLGGGPALGYFQMEPATHQDIWDNYLHYRPDMVGKLLSLRAADPPGDQQLAANACYAAAMCRVHYRRVPAPLPASGDIRGQAAYWKEHYNTPLGAGTVEHYLHAQARFGIEQG